MVMDQVDEPETGVVTNAVREALGAIARRRPTLPIFADSRRSLRGWPSLIFKMNRQELAAFLGRALEDGAAVQDAALELARRQRRPVFITLAEDGMMGADPGLADGPEDDAIAHRAPALPLRGSIDVVGAGDAVSANLIAALAAGADVGEALELANVAASVVVHQLGTTGVATVEDLRSLL